MVSKASSFDASGRLPEHRGAADPDSALSVDELARVVCGPLNAFYCPNDYQPNDSVGYLMRRIISLMAHGVERELEPTGLTNAQWVPLLKLRMGLAFTVAELARECDLDAGSMTRLLDRLEAKSLLRRSRSVDDRRVVNLELTDAGRAAAEGIPGVMCSIQNQLLTGFSLEEWQALQGYLRRMLETAQRIQNPTDSAIPASPASGRPQHAPQNAPQHASTQPIGGPKNV